jgi:RNA polymerase sigma-70 factor (ECF subfamily)
MPAVGDATAAERYEEASALYGAALERLARAYEPDPDRRLDLLQEIHIALWRSLAGFDGRCSLRTWVYRVAHNTATSQVIRRRASAPTLVGLDELAAMPIENSREDEVDQQRVMKHVLLLVHALAPLDRQVILLYLEGMDASTIGEITGLSSGNVATKVHRIKKILSQRFHQGGHHVE